jgi:cytochrome c biogenesis protein CcmG/thiol:disulfide interchange protein DsbE
MQLAQYTQIPIYGLNYKDNANDARELLAKHGNPYLASGFDEKGRVGMDWGVIGTPETFVVDKHGVVRYKHVGPLNPDILKQKILPLIKQLESN